MYVQQRRLAGGGCALGEWRPKPVHPVWSQAQSRRQGVQRRWMKRMDESIELTKHNRRMVMTMAFNYGGRAEIIDAVRALVEEGTPANKIDEKAIRRHLYFPDMPDPDLVIRTSGETRISNFLLWEIAYSELIFPEVLWPDMRRRHLYEAVIEYQRRVRRFGAVNP